MIHKDKSAVMLFVLSSALLLLGLIIGFAVNGTYNFNSDIKSFIEENSDFPDFRTETDLFWYILLINFKLIALLTLGSFLFGSTTFVNPVANGLNFSMLIIFANSDETRLEDLVILTLPHGIFEIPAIIIAGAAGFKIPYEVVRYLAGKKEQILTKEDIKEYFTLVLESIILIGIAAFIEAYITPRMAEYLLSKGI